MPYFTGGDVGSGVELEVGVETVDVVVVDIVVVDKVVC